MGKSGKERVKPGTARRFGWLALLSPCLFLAIAEGVLRLSGFGYPAGYLRSSLIDGKPVFTGNPDFFRAFFPPRLAPYPDPIAIPAEKDSDTRRIFILGESAALGIPDPAFGFGRILERMLVRRHPSLRFEVINLSVTAIDSHVLLPIAWAAARRRPDLFIVYMGNNEVIGPYGPGTVFAPFASGTGWIRAARAVKATRTGQLLDRLALGLRPGSAEAGGARKWAGMEMFLDRAVATGDPRMECVYANFRGNLEGILSAARSAGAGVIVSTVAANLRDNAPFASAHAPGLSDTGRREWRALCDSGAALAAGGRTEAALAAYGKAESLDPGAAEAHFRIGRLQLALGRSREAAGELQKALDLDALRFRADGRLNGIAREVARERASAGVWLADADSVFRSQAVDGIPGDEFFYEHVHLRFAGNYLLARTLAPYVESALAAAGKIPVSAPGALLSEAECRASLALTGWDRLRMARKILAMAERPPFTGKSDSAEHRERLRREADSLSRYTENDSLEKALEEYRLAIEAHPGDALLRRNLGDFLYACDYLPQAEDNFRAALKAVPHDTRARQMLAKCLAEQGDLRGAAAEYGKALGYTPGSMELRNGLANSLAGLGEYQAAVSEYRKALAEHPGVPEIHANLARALAALGRDKEAAAEVQAAEQEQEHAAAAGRRNASGRPGFR